MREATASKQRVSAGFTLHPRGLEHTLSRLWPQLEQLRGLTRRAQLVDALQVRLHGGFIQLTSRRRLEAYGSRPGYA